MGSDFRDVRVWVSIRLREQQDESLADEFERAITEAVTPVITDPKYKEIMLMADAPGKEWY